MFTNDANGPYCWNCSLNVEWHDCSFCPVIQLRRGILERSGTNTKPMPAPMVLRHPARRRNLFKPLRTGGMGRRSRKAFTLVELLTVIAIIGILAAMLMPVLAAAKKHALIMRARTEMNDLVTDIQAYDQAYGRFPVSHLVQTTAATYGVQKRNPDFTYGGTFKGVSVGTLVQEPSGTTILTNAEVVAILMDYTNYPYNPAIPTVNMGHVCNPQQTKFLNAKMSGWDPSQSGQPEPGVGNDLAYRDPWGNPYVISMDLNYDDLCRDSFYASHTVSQTGTGSATAGFNGLTSLSDPGQIDSFQFHGKVMVWSAGPDGKVDAGAKANTGANKDNILSWQ